MEYNIEQFLSQMGYEPVYRHVGYGMYISPLRKENDASFKVDYNKNLWYDFGIGKGGDIFSLYTMLHGCSIKQAKEELSPFSFSNKNNRNNIPASSVKVISCEVLHSQSLISYIEQRNIPFYIARTYCQELKIECSNKSHLVLGFKNDLGGWEMRNKYIKIGSSPKTISTIVTDHNDVCNVFEGFMDYLSLVSVSNNRGVPGTSIILNSVINLSKADNLLRKFDNILCYLDNDKAGQSTLQSIKTKYSDAMVTDCSIYYKGYKDLNDCLTGKYIETPREKVECQNTLQAGLK